MHPRGGHKKKLLKHKGFLVTTSYIKKRNLFCLVFKTKMTFSAISPILKEKLPHEYLALKNLRDLTYKHWEEVAKAAQRDMQARLSKCGLPQTVAQRAISGFKKESAFYVLTTVDGMLFPNESLFRMRLKMAVQQKVKKCLRSMKEVSPTSLKFADDDDDRTDDEIITTSSIAETEDSSPFDLLVRKEEALPNAQSIIDELEGLGFSDEADYVRRVTVSGRGRLTKYEAKKIKGAVMYLTLSLRRKKKDELQGA